MNKSKTKAKSKAAIILLLMKGLEYAYLNLKVVFTTFFASFFCKSKREHLHL